MTPSHVIGNLLWRFRRNIISAFVFAASVGSYFLPQPYLAACGGGNRALGAKLIACAVAWISGR
jgi:hypothetical protein